MALKFLDENGEGNTADAANAIDYAVAHGARIVNASWGGPSFSQALYGAIRRAGDRGTMVVAAAGQRGRQRRRPARLPRGLRPAEHRVGGGHRPRPTGCSTSPTTAPRPSTSARPATTSTRPSRHCPTRAATHPSAVRRWPRPSSAGAAALYLSKFPQATVDQIKAALLQSVDPLAHARRQDRHRWSPEHRPRARRGLAVHAAHAGHDAPLGVLPDPPALPPRDAQASTRLQVAALTRLRAASACTASI